MGLHSRDNSLQTFKMGLYRTDYWTPSQITTDAWWDPSDPVNSSIISGEFDSLTDLSGNGFTIDAPAAGQRPTESTINGLAALDIVNTGGSGDRLCTASNVIANSDDYTIFAIAPGSSIGRGADTFGDGWSIQFSRTGHIVILDSGGAASYTADGPDGDLVVAMTDQNSAQQVNHATNGSVYTTASAPKTSLRTSTRFFELGTTNGTSAAGKIGEVIILTRVATTDEKEKIEGYLAWKWGYEGSLASGHPYEFEPPFL